MKKLIAVVFVALLTSLAGSVWAAFTGRQKLPQAASATTVGTSTVAFSVALADVNNPDGTTGSGPLTWTNIDPGNTVWKLSERCLVIRSTINVLSGGGIQMYTDNYNPPGGIGGGFPKYLDLTPTISTDTNSDPAGLVMSTGTSSSFKLPMAWSVKSSSQIPTTQIAASDPNTGPTTSTPDNKYQWLFVQDKNTPAIAVASTTAFGNGTDYVTVINQLGIHFGQGFEFGGGMGVSKSYLYFEANFAGAIPNATYSTNVYLEAYTD